MSQQPLPTVHVYVEGDVPGVCKCQMPASNRVHITTEQMQTRPDLRPVESSTPVMGANLHPLSNEAAIRAWATATTMKARVFRAILLEGPKGCIDHDLAEFPELLGARESSLRPRRIELEQEGLVCPALDADGNPVTRATPTGAQATVWVLTEHAQRAMTPKGERPNLTVVRDEPAEVPTDTDPRLEVVDNFQPPTVTTGDHRTRVYCQTCTDDPRVRGYCAPLACYCKHPACYAYKETARRYPEHFPRDDSNVTPMRAVGAGR